ncbi:MAG: ribosome-associated translation inhibitor RaiA [Candidatus Latescibacteria bacterium]|nr:ribosome-associated translation inhibitor RaiA [Candidatus Latescibacterota bacterium]
MKVQIVGRHFEVSDKMRSHIEKEAEKLEKFFDRIIDCQVLVGAEKRMRTVEVLVNVHAHTLKATRSGSSVYQALEEAMDRVKVQLKKHHNKLRERRGGGIKKAAGAAV